MASSSKLPLSETRSAVTVASCGEQLERGGERVPVAYQLDDGCSRLFRRRQILAFLRRDNLPTTFDWLRTEAFFDVRLLQCMVESSQWQRATGYICRFVPPGAQVGAEVRAVMRFLQVLNILDDLGSGNPAGARMVDSLDKGDIMNADTPHTEILRTIFHMHAHPEERDSLDWQLVRNRAAEHVDSLIRWVPELSHMLRLPQCPTNAPSTISFGSGFGNRRRLHKKKSVGRTPASLLARRFLQKKRPSPSANGLGSEIRPMFWLERTIHDALIAGEQKRFKEEQEQRIKLHSSKAIHVAGEQKNVCLLRMLP